MSCVLLGMCFYDASESAALWYTRGGKRLLVCGPMNMAHLYACGKFCT